MSPRDAKPSEKGKRHPEYRIVSFELVNDMDDLIQKLTRRVDEEFPEVLTYRTSKCVWCYKDVSMTPDSLFAVLLARKRGIHVRIGVDSAGFRDEKKLTKACKGRFFKKKREERGFTIDSPERLDYAIELIKQCY